MPRKTIESKQRLLTLLHRAGLSLTPETTGIPPGVFDSLEILRIHNEERRMGHKVRDRLRKKLIEERESLTKC